MAKRKAIKNSDRFEVFKRDKFTCQYCGRQAPDVILEIDHVHPVSKDGQNNILNYVTACYDCNHGKGARELDDSSAVKKQKRMLDELQERRDQIEMMLAWHNELSDLENITATKASEYWSSLVTGFSLNDIGMIKLKKMLRTYTLDEVLTAMQNSIERNLKADTNGIVVNESAQSAFSFVEKTCKWNRNLKEKPYLNDLHYIRGIMRNRFYYPREWEVLNYLEQAYLAGVEIETLKQIALNCRNWSEWIDTISDCMAEAQCPG